MLNSIEINQPKSTGVEQGITGPNYVAVVVLGYGNIGKQFVEILQRNYKLINEQAKESFKLVAVANSRFYQYNPMGILDVNIESNIQSLSNQCNKQEQVFDELVNLVKQKTVVVDLTASEGISQKYLRFAENGWHIISANKLAAADAKFAESIEHCLKSQNRKWLKNTTVGAALPVQASINNIIYASFTAIAMSCMKQGGQLVAITPRSFTNGLYFKGFRSYMLGESALDLIHIFKKRDKVFKNEDSAVLQENVIFRFVKGLEQSDITVRSSNCDSSISNADEEHYALPLIIDPSNDQQIIRIPESAYEAAILRQAETFQTTFANAGYFISTGRVVEHRTRPYITDNINTDNSVPLYRPHNVTPLQANWTGEHKKDVVFKLNEGHEKHTMKNGNFVLLKRFSSKDEKRRLVSGVHLENVHECELIGFGNKTNYIGLADGKLTKVEAYGLAAIFNSSFMDKYFRCMSGNTQVNATEIRVMKFPAREQVKEIGRLVQKLTSVESSDIDLIVNPILCVMDTI